jgi:hypothetical protein
MGTVLFKRAQRALALRAHQRGSRRRDQPRFAGYRRHGERGRRASGDRADAENSFDELKNQWGWGGFTSRKLGSSRLMANLVALFYNWWNLYVRFFDEDHHREAIRSRPLLMQGVGRQVQSGGQRTVKVGV